MIHVGVSGAGGRMGRLVAAAVEAADDMELRGAYDPESPGEAPAGAISPSPSVMEGCDVVVEFTRPDVVMENLTTWRAMGAHAVVGTSGFDAARLARAAELWPSGPPNLLIVPNFSIGAAVMFKIVEAAAAHFSAAEVIELHHDGKADAPSGTAVETARRIAATAPDRDRPVTANQTIPGSRGADVEGVRVHAVRLPGLVAHQEVIFGGPGETLSIRHDTTDRASFIPGVLLAVRSVGALDNAVTVGLGGLLGL